MKRFIIISLMTAMTLPTLACAGGGTDNYYLFSPFVGNNFKSRVEKICNDNWKAYLGNTLIAWTSNSVNNMSGTIPRRKTSTVRSVPCKPFAHTPSARPRASCAPSTPCSICAVT